MTMKHTIEEQISALLDSELPIEEEALLLKRLQAGDDHRRTLGRYALIGDLIRGSTINRGTLGLSESVSAAVATEQPHAAGHAGGSVSLGVGRWLVGGAIAASVAALALVNIELFRGVDGPSGVPVAASELRDQPVSAAPISYTVPPSSAAGNVIATERLTGYLVSHAEYSNSLSRRVMNSYVVNQMAPPDDERLSSELSGDSQGN